MSHIGPGVPLPGWEGHPRAEFVGGIIYPDPHIDKIIDKIKSQHADPEKANKAAEEFLGKLAQYGSNAVSRQQFRDSVPDVVRNEVNDYCLANEKLKDARNILFTNERLDLDPVLKIRGQIPEDYKKDLDLSLKDKMVLGIAGTIETAEKVDSFVEGRVNSYINELNAKKQGLSKEEQAIIDSAIREINNRLESKRRGGQ